MKLLVVYDSEGGNTKKMAYAIAEGATSVEGVEAEVKKIGEPFSLKELAGADIVAFGSPVIYADVTDAMESFLEHAKGYIDAGKMDVRGRRAAIFGSYGYDGAWTMEERFKGMVENLGYVVDERVCVEIDTDLKYHPAAPLGRCRAFGKDLAESLK